MWVVFIVGCIPTVRPLFVKVLNVVISSGQRTFRTGRGYTEQDDSYTNTSRGRTYSQNRKNTSKITTSAMKTDSEENILSGQQGIMMTRDIRVQYQSNEDEGTTVDKTKTDPDIWKSRSDDQV